MTKPIMSMSFHPRHGGGGGNFYMGRQDEPDEQDEQDEEEEAETSSLEGDRVTLESHPRSQLSLPGEEPAPAEDWEATGVEIKNSLRYMTLAVSHMERDYARRQHAETGSVTIFQPKPKK